MGRVQHRVTNVAAAIVVLIAAAGFITTVDRTTASAQRADASVTNNSPGAKKLLASRLTADTTVLAFPAPPVQAKAAYLMDMNSHEVLYAKNQDERLSMASTTKITTAAVVLANARLSDMVTVSKKAATIGESTMSLVKGERLSVLNLLYGMLLNSGNDAAIALAEHVGGTEDRFVAMMNLLARTLGMSNTHYANAHGLDAPKHYSSARDLATMALYAMRDPTFRQIVSTTSYHIPATKHNLEHWLSSVNRVLYWFPGVDGVKPGQTDNAGLCQVVSAWRGGRHLLAVVLNTPNLWVDVRNLLDYGSRDFRWVQAPVWSDAPADTLSGGAGTSAWMYHLGAGHYVRGAFLRYFQSHGGLQTLGYPRTEQIVEGTHIIQYFQGAELIADATGEHMHQSDFGTRLARLDAANALWPGAHVTPGFAGAYKRFGGAAVLGSPLTGTTRMGGYTMQFFQFGIIAEVNNTPVLVPVGDAFLRLKGWLPATAPNSYPVTVAVATLAVLPA